MNLFKRKKQGIATFIANNSYTVGCDVNSFISHMQFAGNNFKILQIGHSQSMAISARDDLEQSFTLIILYEVYE